MGGAGRVRRGKNGASAGGVFSDERNRHGDAGISGSGQSGAGLRCVLAACRFGIKTLGIVKPGCFFVRTENVYEWRTCTSGERVWAENGYYEGGRGVIFLLQYKNIYDMLPKILLIMSNLNYIV